MGLKNKPKSIHALLDLALNTPDDHNTTSIWGK
jgi:hypothetical protein